MAAFLSLGLAGPVRPRAGAASLGDHASTPPPRCARPRVRMASNADHGGAVYHHTPLTGSTDGPATVHLVGTGPGDPGLMTMRAAQLLGDADVVLYDRLVSHQILEMVGPGARMVYVGKQTSFHTRPQPEIHQMLLQFATEQNYKTVVRLKGGDPYIFGRGGEEMEYLEARGVSVRCVPGITSAAGIGAELGIPLTHRGVATSVRFLTGHLRADNADPQGGGANGGSTGNPSTPGGLEDVEMVVGPMTTLVIYMGLATLPDMSARLMDRGLDPATPAVAVERGTTPDQRQVFGTLDTLPTRVLEAALESPTLIIIGGVVALSRHWRLAGQAADRTADVTGWDGSDGSSNGVMAQQTARM